MAAVDLALQTYLLQKRRRVVTRTEVLAHGGDDHLIARRLTRGHWAQLQVAVYVVGAGPVTLDDRRMAALLAVPQPAALSHRTALVLWELDGLQWAPIDLTVRHGTNVRVEAAIVHRSRRLESFVEHHGYVVTSVERTLLEAGRYLPTATIDKALSSAWRKGLTTPAACLAYAEEFGSRRRPGTTKLLQVASRYGKGERAPGSDGEVFVERFLVPRLKKAGLELPTRQHTVHFADGGAATLDLAWPERRKAIEPGGLRGHGSVTDQDADFQRRSRLRAIGWEVEALATISIDRRPEETADHLITFLRSPSLPLPSAG